MFAKSLFGRSEINYNDKVVVARLVLSPTEEAIKKPP